jgi:ribosomal protein L40E
MPTQPYTVHNGEAYPCPQCGSMNDDDASFCDQCGAKMPVGPRGPAVAEMGGDETQQCQSCLSMNATDAKFCDQCGSSLAGVRPWRTPGGGYTWDDDWAQRHPGRERRDDAAGEVANDSDAPDYNPGAQVQGDGTHPPMTGTHSHAHAAYGADDSADGMMHTHEHSHRGDANHAPVAAASGLHDHQYNADGTIVLDDSGVVEEVGGALADADLLSRRLRLLELA